MNRNIGSSTLVRSLVVGLPGSLSIAGPIPVQRCVAGPKKVVRSQPAPKHARKR